jgi:hypothetical protein
MRLIYIIQGKASIFIEQCTTKLCTTLQTLKSDHQQTTWKRGLVEQDLLILRKHLGSPPGCRGIHVAHLLVFCVVIVLLAYDPCLVCIFSNYLFNHVTHILIYMLENVTI